MGRKPSVKRLKAKEIWLESYKKMKLKDIAEKLKVSEQQIRKWKSEDKWDLEPTPRRIGKNGKPLGRPKGSGLGKQNALGNKGGCPAYGNKNAVKTGEFEKIFFDTLSVEEMKLINNIHYDKILALEKEVAILTVREHRMLKRIEEAKKNNLNLIGVNTTKKKNSKGNVFEEEIQSNAVTSIELILRLEEALTRVQEKKIKTIEAISRIELGFARLELEKGVTDEDEDTISSWLNAVNPSEEDIQNLFKGESK